MERAGFEPAKVKPPDLQSGPVGRLGNLSFDEVVIIFESLWRSQEIYQKFIHSMVAANNLSSITS